MARFTAGGLTTAGSTTLPIFALVGGTGVLCRIREIGIFNTTATACSVNLCRLSTAGTPGATLTAAAMNTDPAAAVGVLKNTYTSTAPTTSDIGLNVQLGAAVGSGFVWTFEDFELTTLVASNAAVGALVASGTGQALRIYVKWFE